MITFSRGSQGIMSRRNQARKANGSRSGEETNMNTDARGTRISDSYEI
ncbi:hypothetical protein HanIR_Chr02g0073931 [Helianthus annuus]|nr:hypothetical protein HanIR_Chr02g0073931 [Helianthus annuus]